LIFSNADKMLKLVYTLPCSKWCWEKE